MDLHKLMSPVGADGVLVAPFADLLELFGVDPTTPLPVLAVLLKDKWVTKGHERWEEPDVVLDDHRRVLFWQYVCKLPLYDEIRPDVTEVDHVLNLGGRLPTVDRKNAMVARLAAQGHRFGAIHQLGGDRKVGFNELVEGISVLGKELPGGLPVKDGFRAEKVSPYETEAEMMEALWKRSQLPPSLSTVPVHFIGAQATTGFRAHTGDTYARWLDTNPQQGGTVVIVSISPHGPFQYWDAVNALKGFNICVVAPSAALGPQEAKYFTGAIARWIRSYVRATENV